MRPAWVIQWQEGLLTASLLAMAGCSLVGVVTAKAMLMAWPWAILGAKAVLILGGMAGLSFVSAWALDLVHDVELANAACRYSARTADKSADEYVRE
jgi:hypothetical protein